MYFGVFESNLILSLLYNKFLEELPSFYDAYYLELWFDGEKLTLFALLL